MKLVYALKQLDPLREETNESHIEADMVIHAQEKLEDRKIRVRVVADKSQLPIAIQGLFAEGSPGLEIAVEWVHRGSGQRGLASGPGEGRGLGPYVQRLPVRRAGGVIRYLKVEQIDWIEAANQYVRLQTRGQGFLVRESMARLESWLVPEQFLRIHRSAIVNLDRVVELQMEGPTSRWVILVNGHRLRVSQRRWQKLQQALIGLH